VKCYWLYVCIFATGCATSNNSTTVQKGSVFTQPKPLVISTEDTFAPSANRQTLVYIQNQDGNLDIYARDLSTSNSQRLTSHSTDDTSPALSPNGKHIAWVSQANDTQGDVWLMDSDGSHKTRLTGRETIERSPTFSPNGQNIYFAQKTTEEQSWHIAVYDTRYKTISKILDDAWDPSISTNGKVLFFIRLGNNLRPQLFAKDLLLGTVVPVTDGTMTVGLPHALQRAQKTYVVFTRFFERKATGLWRIECDPLSGKPLVAAVPLTEGSGEIFATTQGDVLLYSAFFLSNYAVFALPADGTINPAASDSVIFDAALSEKRAPLRKLAWRYLIATSAALANRSRYQLAAEFARDNQPERAIANLKQIDTSDATLHAIAQLEIMLLQLTQDPQQASVILQQTINYDPQIIARQTYVRAQAFAALGDRVQALQLFSRLASDPSTPHQDAIRSLANLALLHALLGDIRGIEQTCVRLLKAFPQNTYEGERCVDSLLDTLGSLGGDTALANIESIASRYTSLPLLNAKARLRLAELQAEQNRGSLAIEGWRQVLKEFAQFANVRNNALMHLAQAEERRDIGQALVLYTQLLEQLEPDDVGRQDVERHVSRLELLQATKQEQAHNWQAAKENYQRLLQRDPTRVQAQRRYIELSSRLGKPVISDYRRYKNSSNKTLRYAYAYALTFKEPPDLDSAENVFQEILELDPRYAPAHLTLGWIALQREYADPNNGWLEKAVVSTETARDLLDPNIDVEMFAAVQLNLGNALFALGKTDGAFAAFLQRTSNPTPFSTPLAELLFRMSFARVALAREEYDVALDMAHAAVSLSRTLPTRPRLASLTLLEAVIYLQTGMHRDAVATFDAALKLLTDTHAQVAALRGKALAQKRQRQYAQALETEKVLIERLKTGDFNKPVPPGLAFLYNQEIPNDPRDITQAIYGFSKPQEEQLAYAEMSRDLHAQGDWQAAQVFNQARMSLLQKAARDSTLGPRIAPELLFAHNESAKLAVAVGAFEEASNHYFAALQITKTLDDCEHAPILLNSLQNLWTQQPILRTPEHSADVSRLALGFATSCPGISFERWFALEAFTSAVGKAIEKSTKVWTVATAEAQLTEAVVRSAEALEYAKKAKDTALAFHIAAWRGDKADVASDSSTWRQLYDRSLWQASEFFTQAIEAFEKSPSVAPETPALVAHALDYLTDHHQIERAWHLLEAPELKEVQATLGSDAALLQIFAPSKDVWHWFIITPKNISHMRTQPMSSTVPASITIPKDIQFLYLQSLGDVPVWQWQHAGKLLKQNFDLCEVKSARDLVERFAARSPTTTQPELTGKVPAQLASMINKDINQNASATIVNRYCREHTCAGLRLWGYRGLNYAQRVELAAERFWTGAKNAIAFVKAARTTQASEDWQRVADTLLEVLNLSEFLQQPQAQKVLAHSSQPLSKRLTSGLATAKITLQDQLADVYLAQHKLNEAVALRQQVADFQEKAGKQNAAASAWYSLGAQTYGPLGKHSEAVEALTRCIQQSEGLQKARCLRERATEFRALFEYAKAIDDYTLARDLFANTDDAASCQRYIGFVYENALNHYDNAKSAFEKALAMAQARAQQDLIYRLYLDMARMFRLHGNYEIALTHSLNALKFYPNAGHADRSEASLEMAKIAWYRGDYREALHKQKEGLQYAELAGDKFRQIQALSLAGLIALNQGELQRAEQSLKDALSIARLTGRKSEQAIQLNNLGIVKREAGELSAALALFQEALAIDIEISSIEGRAYDLRNLGITYFYSNDLLQAHKALQEALSLSENLGVRYNELQSLLALAEITLAKSLGQKILDLSEAQQLFEKARQLAERIAVPELRWRAYDGLARVAVQNQQLPEARRYFGQAFAIAEKLNHTAFRQDNIARNRQDLFFDTVMLEVQSHNETDAFAYQERARVCALRERGVNTELVNIKELQRTLRSKTVILTYLSGRQNAIATIVTSATLSSVILDVQGDTLVATVNKLAQKLSGFSDVTDELNLLSKLLMQPLKLPSHIEQLVIIPDDQLYGIPFASLHINAVSLVDRAPLSLAYSASDIVRSLRHTVLKRPTYVVALAPNNDLFFSRLEAQAVGTKVLIGPEATFNALTNSHADALDLAAHSERDTSDLALVLSEDKGNDGRLRVNSFGNWRAPKLVTLSACDALREPALSAAFFKAGTQTLVGSYGRISDLASAVLMKRFYQEIKTQSAAKALQNAAQWTRKYFSHPAHWAMFAVLGDYR
jgi:tetratricopeptide (TPR) repeat protein